MGSSSGSPEPSPPFYAPLEARLKQCDIVRPVPWGIIVDPLTICKRKGGPHQATVNVMADVPTAFKKGPEDILARAELSLGMVVWPDCQIDKFMNQGRPEEKWFACVAPVMPLAPRLEPPQQESVRAGRRRAYFYIPASDALGIPESYVDLRYLWPLNQRALTDRVAALSTAAQGAFCLQLFEFLTYMRLRDSAACPSCGQIVNLADALGPVGEDRE